MITQDIESLRTENEECDASWRSINGAASRHSIRSGSARSVVPPGAPWKVIDLTAPSVPHWPAQTDPERPATSRGAGTTANRTPRVARAISKCASRTNAYRTPR
jgi:hypothetical protein